MTGSIFTASDPTLARMANVDAAVEKAKSGLSAKKLADIDQSSKDFESMFVSEMIQPMFETVQTDQEFGGGQAEDTWKGMMVQEYGKKITAAGGIGLSDTIKAKMIEMQEAAQNQNGQTQSQTGDAASNMISNIAQGSLDGSDSKGSK